MIKQITADEVEVLQKTATNLEIIDVRETMEVMSGKIPEAIHIPLGELQNRFKELDKTKEYIIVCRSGNRSGVATQFLQAQGYDASNMVGGMIDWNGAITK